MKRFITHFLIGFACFTTALSAVAVPKSLAEKIAIAEAIPDKVNVNKAEVEHLILLPGIGTKKARAIIAYREQHGPFKTLQQLQEVKGIGSRMIAKLTDKAVVR